MRRATLRTVLVAVAIPGAALPLIAGAGTAVAVPNPVATNEATYQAFGRVFPDPHGCLAYGAPDADGDGVKDTPDGVSPWAKGRVCADQFLSYEEVISGGNFLSERFPRFVEVIRLADFAGKPWYKSEGIPRTVVTKNGRVQVLGRDRRPLYMFKVTDARSPVPERERSHFAYSLSVHGIERAGLEGGVRAMEDLVTWTACELDAYSSNTPACATEGPFPKKIVETGTKAAVPTAGDVLRNSVVYFFMPNPDGWARGQVAPVEQRSGRVNQNYTPGVFFQRYNGNGVDLNRDWPSVGYTFKPYSPGSEQETISFRNVLRDIKENTAAGRFTGGIDLHGMITANAFSYTLLGAGQRDFRKNALTVDTSIRTWEDQTKRLAWSPYVGDVDDDGRMDDSDVCVDDLIFGRVPACVADQWGTVIDTIGYQVTGALGDWLDSEEVGLGAVGIDNEMYTSHIIPNTAFEPALEQSHIDGNKGLIYSQISSLLTATRPTFDPKAKVGYVFNPSRLRLERGSGGLRASDYDLRAQPRLNVMLPCGSGDDAATGCSGATFKMDGQHPTLEFDVLAPRQGYLNSGIKVTVTRPNALGISDGNTDPTGQSFGDAFEGHVQLQFFDEGQWHPAVSDFNQSFIYAQAGQVVTVNDPTPGRWRVWFESPSAVPSRVQIKFRRFNAEFDPGHTEIDASSMDFFRQLNRYVPGRKDLEAVAVADVIRQGRSLRRFESLIVVNNLGSRQYLRKELGLSANQIDAYFERLKDYARGGGNLVLTDRALQALPEVGLVAPDKVHGARTLAGSYHFAINDDTVTYEHPKDYPLAQGVNKPGAAELERGRRQAAEPTPLGYSPDLDYDPDPAMPFWGVDTQAWLDACGRARCVTALTDNFDTDDDPNTEPNRQMVGLGEARLGTGTVRIAGIMFPDPVFEPDESNDHRFGVASYALTYTAYEVFENLIR